MKLFRFFDSDFFFIVLMLTGVVFALVMAGCAERPDPKEVAKCEEFCKPRLVSWVSDGYCNCSTRLMREAATK